MLTFFYNLLLRIWYHPFFIERNSRILHKNLLESEINSDSELNDSSDYSMDQSSEENDEEVLFHDNIGSNRSNINESSENKPVNDKSTSSKSSEVDPKPNLKNIKIKKYESRKFQLRKFLFDFLGSNKMFTFFDETLVPQFLKDYSDESVRSCFESIYDAYCDRSINCQKSKYYSHSCCDSSETLQCKENAKMNDLPNKSQLNSRSQNSNGPSVSSQEEVSKENVDENPTVVPSSEEDINQLQEKNTSNEHNSKSSDIENNFDGDDEKVKNNKKTISNSQSKCPTSMISKCSCCETLQKHIENEHADPYMKEYFKAKLMCNREGQISINSIPNVFQYAFTVPDQRKDLGTSEEVDLLTILREIDYKETLTKTFFLYHGANFRRDFFSSEIFTLPDSIFNHLLALFVSLLRSDHVTSLFNEELLSNHKGMLRMFYVLLGQKYKDHLKEFNTRVSKMFTVFMLNMIFDKNFKRDISYETLLLPKPDRSQFLELFFFKYVNQNLFGYQVMVNSPAIFPSYLLKDVAREDNTSLYLKNDYTGSSAQEISRILIFVHKFGDAIEVPKQFILYHVVYQLISAVVKLTSDGKVFWFPVIVDQNESGLIATFFFNKKKFVFDLLTQSCELTNLVYEIANI